MTETNYNSWSECSSEQNCTNVTVSGSGCKLHSDSKYNGPSDSSNSRCSSTRLNFWFQTALHQVQLTATALRIIEYCHCRWNRGSLTLQQEACLYQGLTSVAGTKKSACLTAKTLGSGAVRRERTRVKESTPCPVQNKSRPRPARDRVCCYGKRTETFVVYMLMISGWPR